jgi:AcrR family transcriptional regulator
MTLDSAQPPVKPRKTPLQSRSRATVDAVLSAAAQILEAQGVGALNTNAVAERAGVSIGSLYQYFSSKDAILVALIERESRIFADELARAADSAQGEWLGDDLTALLRFGLSHHVQRHDLAHLLDVEFQRLHPFIDSAAIRQRSRAAMVRLLDRHRASIQPCNLDIAAQDISVIAKALMESAARRRDDDWNAAIERTVRAMLGYLGAACDGRKTAEL